MPNPVAVNDLSPISGSLQTSRVSYGVETAGKNYGQNYNSTNWYSDIPNNGQFYTIISDNYTANYYVSRSNAGGAYVEGGLPAVDEYSAPVFWITQGTSSLDVITIVNGLPDRIGQIPFNSGSQALNWVASSSNYFAVGPDYYAQIDADNLVYYIDGGQIISYPTTGSTWYDLSGQFNNTILYNGPTFDSKGWLDFDGSDDYGLVSRTLSMSPTASITQEALLNFDADNAVIIGLQYGASSDNSYALWRESGAWNALVKTSGGTQVVQYSQALTTGRWFHFLHTYSGSTQYLYLNGTQVASSGVSGGNIIYDSNNNVVVIGGDFNSGYNAGLTLPFNGKLAKTRIYGKGSSVSEIKQNYYGGPIVTDGLVFAVDAGNLVSYPKSGTTAYTLTGSADGTLINGTGFSSENGGTWVFDGTDDYIRMSRMVQDDFSLCIWFKTAVTSSTGTQWYQGQGLLDAEVGGAVNDFGLAYLNNKAVFGVGNPDTTIQGTTSLNDGVWRYIVATRNRTTGVISLYVNGTLEASGTGNTNTLNASTYIYIGSSNGGAGTNGSINGNVSIAHIYNRVLTSDEVLQNYNATK